MSAHVSVGGRPRFARTHERGVVVRAARFT
jgi:hypothetical protein